MALYADKKRQLEEMERLRKRQAPPVAKLTEEERQRKVLEMQEYAKRLDEDRKQRLYGASSVPNEEDKTTETRKDARFLKDLNKSAYMDSDMNLEERLNRKAHYMDRSSHRD